MKTITFAFILFGALMGFDYNNETSFREDNFPSINEYTVLYDNGITEGYRIYKYNNNKHFRGKITKWHYSRIGRDAVISISLSVICKNISDYINSKQFINNRVES